MHRCKGADWVQLSETEKRFDKRLGEVETYFDKRLNEEISGLRKSMIEGDNSLRVEIHKTKSDLIKWMFIFWIGQIGTLLGILLATHK